MRTHHAALAGLLLGTLTLAARGQADKTYPTPQAVFEAATAAQKKDDFKTLVACFAPEAQKQMAAGLAFTALGQQVAARNDEKLRKQFKAILDALDKHGLTDEVTKKIKPPADAKEAEKVQREVQGLIKDPAALAVDLMTAYSKTEPFNRKPPDMPEPKLTDVKIDGDKARGTVVVKVMGQEAKTPADFVKVGGGWKFAPAPQPAPPPKPTDRPAR
jgi:hypothetical protein